MNIISQLQEPYKNGKTEISPEWSKVLKLVSCAKPISVRGFAKVARKSQVRIPKKSISPTEEPKTAFFLLEKQFFGQTCPKT